MLVFVSHMETLSYIAEKVLKSPKQCNVLKLKFGKTIAVADDPVKLKKGRAE